MTSIAPGLRIEGFVAGAYHRMFSPKIDVRDHPLTLWAKASISGAQSNFTMTKFQLLITFKALEYSLYRTAERQNLMVSLDGFEVRLQSADCLDGVDKAIAEVSHLHDHVSEKMNQMLSMGDLGARLHAAESVEEIENTIAEFQPVLDLALKPID